MFSLDSLTRVADLLLFIYLVGVSIFYTILIPVLIIYVLFFEGRRREKRDKR